MKIRHQVIVLLIGLAAVLPVFAQRVVVTSANLLAFDFDPAMNVKTPADGNLYSGVLILDASNYPIATWQSCYANGIPGISCQFVIPAAAIGVLNQVATHTLTFHLVNIATNLSGPDSQPLIWISKPAGNVAPAAPQNFRFSPLPQ